ncbi:hypothetical protein FWD20_03390 [Candidatus Saccharibacteria bacterium]|nr:hypothetical protein [Candidatus Saccharibacteria bacterium]
MEYIVFFGAGLSLMASAGYIIDTIKGKTKPNRVSWLIWATAPIIGAIAAVSNGVTWAILPTFMAGFGPVLVLAVSFLNKKSYWKLGGGDYLCGVLAILALVLWGLTKNPNVAILLSILADLFAAIPTLVKSWRHPETETGWAYILYMLNQITGFIAMTRWDFSEASFGIYLFVINFCIAVAIYRKRIIKKFKKTTD